METTLHNRQSLHRARNDRRIWRLYFLSAGACILVVPPLFASLYEYSYVKSVLATLLLSTCMYPTARYFARHEKGVPIFPALCLSYAIQFAIPIFTRQPQIRLAGEEIRFLEDDFVVAALFLSLLGVCALQLSYYALSSQQVAQRLPVVDLHLNKKRATVCCIVIGVLFPLMLRLTPLLSDGTYLQFSAIFTLLQNQQLVVIGILGWMVYSGFGTKWHKLLLYGMVGIAAIRGMSNGFLEQAVVPAVVMFISKWQYTKRISILTVSIIVLLILFLSPVKASFRQAIWSDSSIVTEGSGDTLTNASLWLEQASQYWADTLNGSREWSEATSDAVSRADFIHQFAYICSLTPEVIPYQYGRTYSYFTVAWIPRAIWPDKPLSGEANSFFGVTYGLTTEEGIKRVTFGVSLLGEGYINFGTLGVIFIMAVQGAILILLKHIFGGPRSGAGGQAVFLAFFIFFLNGVGTSAEIFFGNIVQNLLCSCALLWWARERPSHRNLSVGANFTSSATSK